LLAAGQGAEKRARVVVESRTGRARRATPLQPGEKPGSLAVDATLKRAVVRLARSGGGVRAIEIQSDDLCRQRRFRPCDNLIVLLVDSSDSMGEGAEARMRACKGAVLALLRRAYQSRSEVALVAFGGEEARVILPPTRNISLARHNLERLPIGGATPFADGLFKAWQLIRRERLKNSGVRPVLVIVSDGEANVPRTGGVPALAELFAVARRLGQDRIVSVLIDVTAEQGKGVEMRRLAAQLGASYVRVHDLKPKHIIDAVPTGLSARQPG
jgi:magnesium chelatase subunit ChlD-like protein